MHIKTDHIFSIIIILLTVFSLFFTYNVISFKNRLSISSKNILIKSGEIVKAVKIIDGDEVLVTYKNNNFVIRLLGIVSYDPTVNDPQTRHIAKSAMLFLENNLINQEIEIIFDEYKVDSKKRLLAYIHKEKKDIGLQMISNGFSLVYTKYPFLRMDDYLVSEDKAMLNKRGLWSDSALTSRSLKLKQKWDSEK